jgi:hypothetical protein
MDSIIISSEKIDKVFNEEIDNAVREAIRNKLVSVIEEKMSGDVDEFLYHHTGIIGTTISDVISKEMIEKELPNLIIDWWERNVSFDDFDFWGEVEQLIIDMVSYSTRNKEMKKKLLKLISELLEAELPKAVSSMVTNGNFLVKWCKPKI